MPLKYVAKPTEVEAIQLSKENFSDCLDFIKNHRGWAAGWHDGAEEFDCPWIQLHSGYPGGTNQLVPGDWLVKENGKFKEYSNAEFEERFQLKG